ncbi:MAG: type II toxin-antitoxin system MqsA family antitoxin [Blautia sp.]|nr:type II toxin-antitoxin system MqsA family antitoxin [Lachnoclostridium sp.]MCM1211634.1 type II toxin-antitoxin system MqsA family antitoxin [Blautia sp.]
MKKTYVAILEECVIIVKNVPAMVCSQCGEVYYTDEVAERLEQIVQKLQQFVKEVAIVEYENAA